MWIDPFYFERDDRVRALVAKGRGFTEEDKLVLRASSSKSSGRSCPSTAAASDRGQVELSTSPFYHPILPLLCDTDIYLRTHPHSRMPRERFRHPEDAAEQLARAVALHERLFGRRPDGLWPSEGSVSDAMVPLVAKAGFRWMATDEEILSRTLGRAFTRTADGHVDLPELLYRAVPRRSRRSRSPSGFATTRCPISSGSPTRHGPRMGPRTTSCAALSRRAAAFPANLAGKTPPSSSSSTARTPGSTTTGRGGRSCGRSISGSPRIPSCTP